MRDGQQSGRDDIAATPTCDAAEARRDGARRPIGLRVAGVLTAALGLGVALIGPTVAGASADATTIQAARPGSATTPIRPPGFPPPPNPTDVKDVSDFEIRADVERIVPGTTFHLAVRFTLAHKWHTYWENPGASGSPTDIAVKAPDGFEIGASIFPRPEIFEGPEGITYGYEKEAVVFVPVKAPKSLEPGTTASFELDLMYLVCKEVCLLGLGKKSIDLPVAASDAGPGTTSKLLTKWKGRLPRALDSLRGGDAHMHGPSLHVRLPAGEATTAKFLPVERPGVRYGEARIERRGEMFDINVPLELSPQNARGKPMVVRGLVMLGEKADGPSYVFERTIPLPGE